MSKEFGRIISQGAISRRTASPDSSPLLIQGTPDAQHISVQANTHVTLAIDVFSGNGALALASHDRTTEDVTLLVSTKNDRRIVSMLTSDSAQTPTVTAQTDALLVAQDTVQRYHGENTRAYVLQSADNTNGPLRRGLHALLGEDRVHEMVATNNYADGRDTDVHYMVANHGNTPVETIVALSADNFYQQYPLTQ